jgi:hypothetical protein
MKLIALALATVFTAAAPAAFAQGSQTYRYDSRDGRYENRNEERYERRDSRDEYRPDTARVLESTPVYAVEKREECLNNRTGRYEELRDNGYRLNRSRCRIGEYGGEILGFDVRYEYQGRIFTKRMATDPGPRLHIGREINSNGIPLDSMGRDLDPNHSGG